MQQAAIVGHRLVLVMVLVWGLLFWLPALSLFTSFLWAFLLFLKDFDMAAAFARLIA